MFNPYSQFKLLYSKDIQIESLVIFFHILRKTIFNQRQDMGTASLNAGTALLLVCVFLNLWVIVRNKSLIKVSIRNTSFFVYYTIFCLFSIFWSITGESGATSIISKGLEIMSSFLALSIILYKIRDVSSCVIYTLYVATIAACCGAYAQGFAHTNSYTFCAMIGVLLAYGLKRKYKINNINIFIILNIICLILGTSSASYISFLCGLILLLSSTKKGINIGKTIVVIGCILLLWHFASEDIMKYVFYGHSEEQIEGGTGRFDIWQQFIDGWKQSPWLGYGYIVGERNLSLMGGMEYIFSAHNGFLSVLINTGIIGCVIFGIFVIRTLYYGYIVTIYPNSCRYFGTVYFAVFCGILVNNMSYPALGSDWNYTFPPLMCVMILMNTWKYKENKLPIEISLEKKAKYYR